MFCIYFWCLSDNRSGASIRVIILIYIIQMQISAFAGSAWEWNDQRQQFYLHQFVVEQPDLDYRNPLVVQEMKVF